MTSSESYQNTCQSLYVPEGKDYEVSLYEDKYVSPLSSWRFIPSGDKYTFLKRPEIFDATHTWATFVSISGGFITNYRAIKIVTYRNYFHLSLFTRLWDECAYFGLLHDRKNKRQRTK
jgi:hypothetical protein